MKLPNKFTITTPINKTGDFTYITTNKYIAQWDDNCGMLVWSEEEIVCNCEYHGWKIDSWCEEKDNEEECVSGNGLLERIKSFTKETNASVFISDGTYKIYYDGADVPAKADTDEALEELMDAISLFSIAVYGKYED